MNNIKSRNYARTPRKRISTAHRCDDTELSFSATAALGILGGTFLVGFISGKLLSMCKE